LWAPRHIARSPTRPFALPDVPATDDLILVDGKFL
jgi:hypothetical protein